MEKVRNALGVVLLIGSCRGLFAPSTIDPPPPNQHSVSDKCSSQIDSFARLPCLVRIFWAVPPAWSVLDSWVQMATPTTRTVSETQSLKTRNHSDCETVGREWNVLPGSRMPPKTPHNSQVGGTGGQLRDRIICLTTFFSTKGKRIDSSRLKGRYDCLRHVKGPWPLMLQ
jgi:hypothetical protein